MISQDLIHYLNADVTEPHVVPMVLETDVALVIRATAVVEKLESEWPCLRTELAVRGLNQSLRPSKRLWHPCHCQSKT